MINIDEIVKWVQKNIDREAIVRPQNIQKNSVPARLVRKYKLYPEVFLWVYKRTPKGGIKWLGLFVRRRPYHKEIIDWLAKQRKRAKKIIEGKKYNLYLF